MTRPARPALAVTVLAPSRAATAATGLGRWLGRAAPARARGTVVIALVSDSRIRALNRRFRGIDRATDVLSFPTEASPNPRAPKELGEIAVALGVARRQAAAAGHALPTEVRILALHGLLHLLGYDHERDGGEMRRVEERLRRRAGLPPGLIARASRASTR